MIVGGRYWIFCFGVLLVGISGLAGADEALVAGDKNDLVALEALTGRWIGLRSELAAERQTWQRQQAHWQREIDLLQQEIRVRRTRLDADADFLTAVEQTQADISGEKDAVESSLHALGAVVGRHEMLLRAWEPLVPQGLLPELGVGFGALPANDAAAARAGVLRRLQTVLALYTQLETLHNTIHVVRELVDVDGLEREAEILYLGLARGFAISAGDAWAAVGTPTAEGWIWQEESGQAASIRLALRVLERDAAAQFVPLLLEVGQEVQP